MSLHITYQDGGKPKTLTLPLVSGLELGRGLLLEPRISMRHLVFTQRGTMWYVHDCSTNGAWLNGARLVKNGAGHALRDGDVRTLPSPPHNVSLLIRTLPRLYRCSPCPQSSSRACRRRSRPR